jgi:dolichyl-phosphate beta-glucosyltransferase
MGRSSQLVSCTVVIPCYNEESRLDEHAFLDWLEADDVELLFVDDGSTDGTAGVLERLARKSPRIQTASLPSNSGKGEAVRLGLRRAIDSGALVVGYLDADLSTPPHEMARLKRALEADDSLDAVFGSRVALLGTHIHRDAWRHYTGRVFATFASLALGVAVYDTQCGAKVFRVVPALVSALQQPFNARWSFDVVLCRRLLDGAPGVEGVPVQAFLEVPLTEWSQKPGSKLSISGSAAALGEVVTMGVRRKLRR